MHQRAQWTALVTMNEQLKLTCTGWTRNIVAWNAGTANSRTAARSTPRCTCWNTQKDTNSAFVRKINIYKYQMYQCIMLEINLKLCLLWLFAQCCTICLALWFFWIQFHDYQFHVLKPLILWVKCHSYVPCIVALILIFFPSFKSFLNKTPCND